MKILLVNPIIRPESPPAYFPLGLASVAGSLLAHGHDVNLLDINAYRWSPLEVQERLRKASFDWIGLTGLITEFNQVKWLAAKVKSYYPDKMVVLGGGLASSVPGLVLGDTAVDIAVIGEGEQTAVDLVHAIEKGRPLEEVPGICFIREGQIHFTEGRKAITDLDSLPPAAWHLFPVDIYANGEKLGFEFPVRTINLISGRGCPYKCTYCFHGIFGYKYRTRSPQKVVEEILYLRDRYHLKGFLFSDDTFTLNREWVKEFCNLLQKYRSDIRWACNGRVNIMDPDLLKLMKESGCSSIFYGIESGSQKILNGINKGATVEQARRVIKWSREAGLDVHGYFIIGAPGETSETIKESIEFCKKTGLGLGLSIATPIPGTEWFDQAVSMGKITDIRSLVTQWACWTNDVVVNLSSLSDEELVTLKGEAEQEVKASLIRNRPLESKFKRWSSFKERYGLWILLLKIVYKLLRSTRLSLDPYTKMQRHVNKSAKLWATIIQTK